MSWTPPPLQPGQTPTAADYNRLRDLIEGLMRSTGPGVSFNNNSLTLKPTDADRIFARITSQGSGPTPAYAYGWNRVFPNGSGGWTDGPTSGADLQWGSPTQSPAWELRQNTAVPVNGSVIVELISGAAETANWYFSFVQDLFGSDQYTANLNGGPVPAIPNWNLTGVTSPLILGPNSNPLAGGGTLVTDTSIVIPASAFPCRIEGILSGAILSGPPGPGQIFISDPGQMLAILYAQIVPINDAGQLLTNFYSDGQYLGPFKVCCFQVSVVNGFYQATGDIIYPLTNTQQIGQPPYQGEGQVAFSATIQGLNGLPLPPPQTSIRFAWSIWAYLSGGVDPTVLQFFMGVNLNNGKTALTYRGL